MSTVVIHCNNVLVITGGGGFAEQEPASGVLANIICDE